jgi:TAG lipase/lysophosphatidylethanolamine acyltransferase
MIGLYSSVDLLAKNKDGKIFIWSAASVKFGSLQAEAESPDQRLAELFNVNHFILSQAQPYIAPFLAQGPRNGKESFSIVQKIMSFVSSELKFRMGQLSRMGLVSSSIGSLFEARIQGHITIAPPLSSMDFYTIFGNPTFQSLHYWIIKGQQSTWPYLTMIKNSTMVESKLYQGFVDSLVIKKIEERNSIKSVPEGETWIRLKKRNLSIA